MKKNLLLLLLIVSSSFINNVTAQKVFIDGYIIRNDGSIIYGKIESVKKDNTPAECIFRWFDIAHPLIYKPGDIKAFGFLGGNRYDTKKIKNRQVFISCLASGSANLYYDGKTMYVETEETSAPVPLTKGNAEMILAGNSVTASGFRDVLQKTLNGKPGFSLPEKINLDKKSVTGIVSSYNRQSGKASQVYAETNQNLYFGEMSNAGKFKFTYGVTAGITELKFKATDIDLYNSIFLPQMTSYKIIPTGGIFVEKQLSRIKDIIDLHAEISFLNNNMYLFNIEEQKNYPYMTIRSDIFIKYSAIKAPVYLQFNLSQKKIVPYISVGGFYSYLAGASYKRNYETEDSNNNVRQFTDNSLTIKNKEYGWLAGFGIKYKINPKTSAFIQGRYESGSGIYYSAQDPLSQSSSSISILAGVKF